MSTNAVSATLIPASDRQRWKDSAVDSRQSFPATGNFDLIDNSWGLVMIHNDDIVSPGEGFDMHQHDNAEIVTWVLDGALRHRDSGGKDIILHSGHAQAISAGRGVSHSEVNAAGYTSRSRLHVIQMWLPPDEENTDPRHGEADFSASIEHSKATGEFFNVAAGSEHDEASAPLHIGSAGARLDISYLSTQATSQLNLYRYSHIFLASGSVAATINIAANGDDSGDSGDRVAGDENSEVNSVETSDDRTWELHEGDVLRAEVLGSDQSTVTFTSTEDAVIMVWRMNYSAKERRTQR
ncbi:pirin family protein [Corynebacterium dentalis]|uniref:pirin family protein n=1 Tax=Corynebacterium dentalis TaxID=2014528 RepID=UPI00289C2D63|nr:pirin family protein [Corynebacterium dentalis]